VWAEVYLLEFAVEDYLSTTGLAFEIGRYFGINDTLRSKEYRSILWGYQRKCLVFTVAD
jgi:hypothetical protein